MNPRTKINIPDGLGLEELLALPVKSAPEFASWGLDQTADDRAVPEVQPRRHTDSQSVGNEQTELSEADLRYLRAVIQQPGKPSSVYPKLAGMGPRRAQAIRDRLITNGYLKPHSVGTSRRGRESILLEPSKAAQTAVAQDRPSQGVGQ